MSDPTPQPPQSNEPPLPRSAPHQLTHSPPPVQPQPLTYAQNSGASAVNTPKKFFLRALAGCGTVFLALALGLGLSIALSATHIPHSEEYTPYVFLAPLVLLFLAALAFTLWKRRFGYVTGIITGTILAFSLAVIGLVILLLAICGGSFKP